MTTLRNASSSRSIDTTTTPPMSSASRSAIDALTSMVAAVVPPTWTPRRCPGRGRDDVVAQGPDEVLGGGLLRPGVGTTVISAVSPAGSSRGGDTAATPAVPPRPAAAAGSRRRRRSGTGPPPPAAARWRRGRTRPASMSYACRFDVSPGRCPRRAGRMDPEERCGQHEQQGDARHGGEHAVPLHQPAPPRPAGRRHQVAVGGDRAARRRPSGSRSRSIAAPGSPATRGTG